MSSARQTMYIFSLMNNDINYNIFENADFTSTAVAIVILTIVSIIYLKISKYMKTRGKK